MVQFGINGDPKISAPWREAQIKDDPVKQSNKRGYITYAMAGPEHPHQPGVHQLRRQRQPRQPGLLAVRPRDLRAWTWSTSSTPNTAKARRAAAVPTRAASRRKATPI